MSQQAKHTIVRPRETSREAGFSLLEVTVASILVLLLAWLVSTLSVDGMRAQKFAERQARVTEIAQDVVDDMRSGLGSTVRVFGNDPIGQAYLGLVDLGALMPEPIEGSRLPLVVAGAMLECEEADLLRTGNELLFARYAWTDEFTVTAGASYRTDVYRLERWYLTPDGPGPRSGQPDGLNLARWVSEPLADGSQVDKISDPSDLEDVLLHLIGGTPDDTGVARDPTEVTWLVGQDPVFADTLRSIDSSGTLSTSAPGGRSIWSLAGSVRLSDPDILVYRHHSVASNFAPPVMGTGTFSIVESTFPHGLEIQIVGTSAARQILLHLTLVSTAGLRRAFHDLQVVVDVRDL